MVVYGDFAGEVPIGSLMGTSPATSPLVVDTLMGTLLARSPLVVSQQSYGDFAGEVPLGSLMGTSLARSPLVVSLMGSLLVRSSEVGFFTIPYSHTEMGMGVIQPSRVRAGISGQHATRSHIEGQHARFLRFLTKLKIKM